jgi:hypothetical protein
MCLKTKLSIKEQNKITKDIGKEGIEVYKVVGIGVRGYHPLCIRNKGSYKEGIDEADGGSIYDFGIVSYKAGFHFYLTKKDADKALVEVNHCFVLNQLAEFVFQGEYKVIKCIVKKSWITTIGEDNMSGIFATTLVAKKAIFPKFRE